MSVAIASGESAVRRRTPRLAIVLVVLAVVLLVVAGVGLVAGRSGHHAPTLRPPSASDPLRAEITTAQAGLAARPTDADGWAALAVLHVESARLGGDPTAYTRADMAVGEALHLDPKGVASLRAQAVLANARHEFEAALVAARAAVAAEPGVASSYAPLVDALVELGRYDEATDAVQAMVDRRPELASYARVAYVRELRGDLPGATEAMQAALRSAPTPAAAGFAQVQLGELAWQQGRLDEAEAAYRTAARLDERSLDAPAGLAKVQAARGDLAGAIATLAPVVDRAPTPGLVVQLSDLRRASGDEAGARSMEELLDAQRRLFQANGAVLDLELSVHAADIRAAGTTGLHEAEAAHRARPSVFAADALAWQLHAAGRDAEAIRYADEALRLGTPRASFHWHRALIRRSLGDTAGADADVRATAALNPAFSPLFTADVQKAIAALG